MRDSCFSGIAHFAPADMTITISNDGELPHTFTAVDGSFNTGQLQPGETFELTVADPGIVRVFCSLHGTAEGDGMAGVLLVGEAEVPPVSAALDVTVIKRAIAEENQGLVDELARQANVIETFREAQSGLARSLNELTTSEDVVTGSQPTVVNVPAASNHETPWVPVLAGLAAGLALAALITMRWTGRIADPAKGTEDLETSQT